MVAASSCERYAYMTKRKAQLKALMAVPENKTCLDCNDRRPTWASIIVPPKDAPARFKIPIGGFCCYQCSGAHRRLGVHIAFVKSTNLDECKLGTVCAIGKSTNDESFGPF